MQIAGWNGRVGDARWCARAICFSAVIGTIVALLGPFGSFYNDLSLRLLDWVAIMLLDTLILGVSVPLIIRAGTAAGLPRPFTCALALAIAAIPAAAVSAVISNTFWGQHVTDYRWYDWYLQTVLLVYVVTGLWAAVEIARLWWADRSQPITAAAPATAGPAGDVICLQMEDHYVRVHRHAGSSLELMPLHEAVRRYGDTKGLQAHRSWWVAAHAVDTAERDLRNWRLRLHNGLTVPIARNRIAEVRRRGWLPSGQNSR